MQAFPLSPRATAFLVSLERRPALPTAEVERIIKGQGMPCFPSWLEFHERYAGYVERFGRDGALWGLAHKTPTWLAPGKADIDRETNEDVWYVTCADAHPSYTYRLDSAGEFIGAPARSFDIHVERIALGWEFAQWGPSQLLSQAELREASVRRLFEERLLPHLVREASDRHANYYLASQYLAGEDAQKRVLLSVRRLSP